MKSSFCRSLDVMSKGGKIFLCLPVFDLVWGAYRISKSNSQNHYGQSLFAAFLFAAGIPFMWFIDLICVLKNGHIAWFKDPFEDGVQLDYFKNQGYPTLSQGKKVAAEEDVETII